MTTLQWSWGKGSLLMTKNVRVIYSRGFTEIQEQTQVLLKMRYCSLNYTAMLRAAVSYCPLSQSTAISKNLAVPSCKRILATGFIDFLHSLMEEWKSHKNLIWYPAIPYHLLYAILPSLQVTLGKDQEYIGWVLLSSSMGKPSNLPGKDFFSVVFLEKVHLYFCK